MQPGEKVEVFMGYTIKVGKHKAAVDFSVDAKGAHKAEVTIGNTTATRIGYGNAPVEAVDLADAASQALSAHVSLTQLDIDRKRAIEDAQRLLGR